MRRLGLVIVMVLIGIMLTPSLAGTVVIGHRGASALRPEHTLAAYELAIEQGADFIEPDLVMTRDGHLIARHEPMLAVVNDVGAVIEETTDVREHPAFADRLRTRVLDGKPVRGWWSDDFTLAEIKLLRARERLPKDRPANTQWNDKLEIPTLDEIIALAKARSHETGRTIGVYPETKHPTFFRQVAKQLKIATMEETLITTLHAAYGNDKSVPAIIQSFETGNLIEMRKQTQIRLAQLIDARGGPFDDADQTYAQMITPAGLKQIAAYADGLGVHKRLVLDESGKPTPLVEHARAAGLVVHAWTHRPERRFLLKPFDNAESEAAALWSAGIDGVFADDPSVAIKARPRTDTRPQKP
jgi:glycerophosphoryl diester phosphodiesterase